jgi:putative NADH-flavin reductase
MGWDYFIENGTFKAKRLPATRGTVKIKDITDLYELRDYLKETNSVAEAIRAYMNCFDSQYMYEVEVETFDEYLDRNPNKFLGGAGKLKGKFF